MKTVLRKMIPCLVGVSLSAIGWARENTTSVEADFERASPNPDEVFIQSISYGGTGCPQGTVASSFSDDRESFTLIYDSFVASTGPNIPITEIRKNCELNINFHIPNGFSVGVFDLDFRGYVQLPAGQYSTIRTEVQPDILFTTSFVGPIAKDYRITDKLVYKTVEWSACGGVVPVNVNSSVAILGDLSKQGQMTIDSTDGKVHQVLGLKFKRCHKNSDR